MSYTTPPPEVLAGYPSIVHLDKASVILRISSGLTRRSRLRWDVYGGPLGSYGRLTIASPPNRRDAGGAMSENDRRELAALLGLDGPVGPEGAVIVGGSDHYVEYIDRAEGRAPRVIGETHPWDVV
jgi:hypothetical protein